LATRADNISSICGTLPYMAPELHKGRAYDGKAADVFALGVSFFVMTEARMPFSNSKDFLYKEL
jgi:serine/threonine protein kinase